MLRIDINNTNLILRDRPNNQGGGVYLFNETNYTGIIYEYFPNTVQLSSESEYKDGILDGHQVEYWQNGQIKEACFQKYDYYVGYFKRWDERGN